MTTCCTIVCLGFTHKEKDTTVTEHADKLHSYCGTSEIKRIFNSLREIAPLIRLNDGESKLKTLICILVDRESLSCRAGMLLEDFTVQSLLQSCS